MKVLLIGLDCIGPEVLSPSLAGDVPYLTSLARRGCSGSLESTLPPITIPAWTSMLTGRDPGELGLYGFRNRRSFRYGDLRLATSLDVRYPRIWDLLAETDRPSLVVGVPQTSPVPDAFRGELICGFEGPLRAGDPWTYPPELSEEINSVVDSYVFDVKNYREQAAHVLLETIFEMTAKRFKVMRHLLRRRAFDFAMIHEIGPDRLHHCFWRYHSSDHPLYHPSASLNGVVRRYYRFLDEQVAGLVDLVSSDTAVLIASDHGAVSMRGCICVNELLRSAGALTLGIQPSEPVEFTPDIVDWGRTLAWAEGGYYARIFLNLRGREPQGCVRSDERSDVLAALRALLSRIELPDGTILHNQVETPSSLYRTVRGLPPDLFVFFDQSQWRSLSTVGCGIAPHLPASRGVDDANHARLGMYVLCGPGVPAGRIRAASIMDVFPTLCFLLGVPRASNINDTTLIPQDV